MALSYDQMAQILEEFEDANPVLASNRDVNCVALEIAPGNSRTSGQIDVHAFELRVQVSRPLPSAILNLVPSRHSTQVQGLTGIDWPVVIVETPRATLEVLQGHGARQVGGGGPGTVGHNFFVRGVGHCMMSNHHVLAVPTTAGGSDIETRDPDATPSPFSTTADLQAWFNNADYDYALGLYRSAADCESAFRPCSDGTIHPFTGSFATGISLNESHRKVGLTTQCTTGNLLGLANPNVGGIARRNQLAFQRMTLPGDSGSIVVHEANNQIVGLHFAGFDHPTDSSLSRSYSNPIYRAGFQLIGYYELLSGIKVPVYDASRAIVPVTPEQSIAMQSPSESDESFDFATMENTQNLEYIGGLLFLGTRTARCSESGAIMIIPSDEPLPVSGGELVRVSVNIHATGGGGRIPVRYSCTVMYFG